MWTDLEYGLIVLLMPAHINLDYKHFVFHMNYYNTEFRLNEMALILAMILESRAEFQFTL